MLEDIIKAIETIKEDIDNAFKNNEIDPSYLKNDVDLLAAVQYDLSFIQERIRKGSSGLDFECKDEDIAY